MRVAVVVAGWKGQSESVTVTNPVNLPSLQVPDYILHAVSFGFRPPAINSAADVAFDARLDDFVTQGIFTGGDPVVDRVIATGDTLDGRTVQGLTFCEEGLNDSGQLGFIAMLEDADSPSGFRMAVFRATRS